MSLNKAVYTEYIHTGLPSDYFKGLGSHCLTLFDLHVLRSLGFVSAVDILIFLIDSMTVRTSLSCTDAALCDCGFLGRVRTADAFYCVGLLQCNSHV